MNLCTFGFHDWDKWKRYQAKMKGIFKWGINAGQEISYIEDRQERSCRRCGKCQDKKVPNDY